MATQLGWKKNPSVISTPTFLTPQCYMLYSWFICLFWLWCSRVNPGSHACQVHVLPMSCTLNPPIISPSIGAYKTLTIQSVICESTLSTYPECLLDMYILGSHEKILYGNVYFNKSPGNSYAYESLRMIQITDKYKPRKQSDSYVSQHLSSIFILHI
jgi:hypothetical protein